MESSSGSRNTKPYLDFGNSRLYFGSRFWLALILIALCIAVSILADGTTAWGRALLAVVGLVGVAIGLLLQPEPKAEDHTYRVRKAIQDLSFSIDLVADIRLSGEDLAKDSGTKRSGPRIVSMNQDLKRVGDQLLLSVVEWDAVAPGAAQDFVDSRTRGREILHQLANEGGNDV